MANIADVNVRIEAQRCANEVQAWLKAIDKGAYYNTCDDHEGYERKDLGENSKEFSGVANGRWTYQSNVEGCFGSEEQRRHWCGNDEDTMKAYDNLVKKLEQDHKAHFLLEYKEAECGMGFVGEGAVEMYFDENSGKVETCTSYEGDDLTIGTLIDYGFADTRDEAKEYMGIEE